MSEIEKLYINAGVKRKYCGWLNIKCPEFTAEKQLKLLLFLLNKGNKLDFKNESKIQIRIEEFTDSIAGLINTTWQNLTDTEKAEIKRILE